MANKFYYTKTSTMTPREGVEYATTYYKQTLEQRQALTNHIRQCLVEMITYLDSDPAMKQWVMDTQLTGFPKTRRTGGGRRTMWEIMEDMAGEAQGRQKNGLPKDYAMAPIQRWNKLFADTDYAFEMHEGNSLSDKVNELFDIEA